MQNGTSREDLVFGETAIWRSFTRNVQSVVGTRHDSLLAAGGEVTSEYLKLVRTLVESVGRSGGIASEATGSGESGKVFEYCSGGCGGLRGGQGVSGGSVPETPREPARDAEGVRGMESDDSSAVKESTLANRAKRQRRKLAKERKRAEVVGAARESPVVPEWRRNGAGVGFHKGVFSECSQDTQLALRESRARMLIAKNEAAVVEAEERARKTAAMLKSRMIEENVEKERLELEKKMKVLRDSAAMPQGYCETVLSALATPSLSDGTISPDSSISSAEVHKKDEAIKMLVNQCDEQRKESEKTKLLLQETVKKLESLEASTAASRKAREEAIRERVRRERDDMYAGRQAGPGWAGVREAREAGKTEYMADGTTKIVWS